MVRVSFYSGDPLGEVEERVYRTNVIDTNESTNLLTEVILQQLTDGGDIWLLSTIGKVAFFWI